ncbi:hypothetical protein [Actinomycetospora sp. NBRC 106378]|uniref:hypothetical protein n=1 Tax=Actinomycetospora sp. NBRC 106378 TaxID=3032208 RepID=UPI0024A4FFAC|nr:hypothetical protein [Actinomycetospora sp. NBRC 106378]GLZ53437.1 hypothetical protein Acsp07_30540 [Actinomycetospora sp. NBRC 106378]
MESPSDEKESIPVNDRPHHGRAPHRPVVFDPESGRWEVSPAYRSNPSIPPPRLSEPDDRPPLAPLDAAELHTARHRRPSPPQEPGPSPALGAWPTPAGRRVGIAAAFVGTFLLGYLLGDGVAASGSPGDPDTGATSESHIGAAATPGSPRAPSSAES